MCMYMCISACVCICVDTCECMTVLHMYACIGVCMCASLRVCMCASLHVCTCIYVCMCAWGLHVCAYVCACVPWKSFQAPPLFWFQLNGHFHREDLPDHPTCAGCFCSPVSLHLALTSLWWFCLLLCSLALLWQESCLKAGLVPILFIVEFLTLMTAPQSGH